ncbi:MAG: FeS-binding protein, partial [Desulfovibrio sp.]|nr:FeS-binding protein [Desulfovibrio sp.]
MRQGVTVRLAPAAGPDGAGDASPVSFTAQPGEGLARAIWLSGAVPPRPLCMGLGRCGRCRVRYVGEAPPALPEDEAVLRPQEVAAGWRLACRRCVPDMAPAVVLELELPPDALASPLSADAPTGTGAPGCAAQGETVVLGVDLGTTSLQWRAVAVDDAGEACSPGRVLAEGSELNPQAGAGADVMSRLAFARTKAGLATLGGLARAAVAGIAGRLAASGLEPGRICLAANTAMTDIFLGMSVEGLCAAPYRHEHPGGAFVEVPSLPPVLIPPLPAPFVGGDVSAGLPALLSDVTPRPFVLADLGTNGELALCTEDDHLFLASVPLGPALE